MGAVTFTRIIMSPQVERGHLPLLLVHGQEMPSTQPAAQSHFPTGVYYALLDCIRSCTLSSLEVCKKKFEKPQSYHSYHASGWRDDLSVAFHVFMSLWWFPSSSPYRRWQQWLVALSRCSKSNSANRFTAFSQRWKTHAFFLSHLARTARFFVCKQLTSWLLTNCIVGFSIDEDSSKNVLLTLD